MPAKRPSKKQNSISTALGWIPDVPDHRDHVYAAPLARLTAKEPLPAKWNLRKHCPPVYTQGRIGSCTANAIAAAIEFDRKKQQLDDFVPSRLFIYYNERAIEHTIASDAGAQIRDGIKTVAKQGVCPETEWPYDDTPADPASDLWPAGAKPAQQPSKTCYRDALKFQLVSYQRVNRDLGQMKGCIADGYPFVLGFTVYAGFMSQTVRQTGILNMPAPNEAYEGGHAVMAVGYDDTEQRFIVRNSWGHGWGKKGYFTMPYAYLLDAGLSDDFWTIRVVE